jgi:adenosylhomocysteine nucleosidase
MDPLFLDDPCILFALRREAQPFYREFRPQQRFPGAPCRARFCGPEFLPVLVLETGMGPAAVESALQWVLSKPAFGNLAYRPKCVIAAGFAGALREEQAVGDIILATDVAGGDPETCWPTTWPGELPPGEWRPPLHRGRLVSTDQLIGDPEQKRRLGVAHDALAVDMESATVARLCQKHSMPFGCVRAISDAVHTPLSSELATLLAAGRVSPVRLLACIARRPSIIRELWSLARGTRLAAEQLQKALGELLTLTLEWGKDL